MEDDHNQTYNSLTDKIIISIIIEIILGNFWNQKIKSKFDLNSRDKINFSSEDLLPYILSNGRMFLAGG
jgi:hypothetical protein